MDGWTVSDDEIRWLRISTNRCPCWVLYT